MPRGSRIESRTGFYHWINRGVNQKKLFHKEADFKAFLGLIREYKDRFHIQLFHYCLMTNHVHLLLKADSLPQLIKFSYFVQRRYAYYYCRRWRWKGQVFQRMYKSLPIGKDSYLLECGRYIERNPVRAGLVKTPEKWPYSSYAFYWKNQDDGFLTPSPAYLNLSKAFDERKKIYRAYVSEPRVYEDLIDKVLLKS